MSRRSGLGKGLDALIPVELREQSEDAVLRDVLLDQVVANRYQPRDHFDEEALGQLAASVGEIGVLQPILVRETGDGYEVIAGERRLRAARKAGLTTIPALVRSAEGSSTLEAALVENLHREDLNALEEAAAYRQLMGEFGLTQDQIASRVGRSRSAIANTIRLLQLPVAIQRLIVEGLLSAGHGRALLTIADEDDQRALADEIVRDQLTVREVEQRLRAAPPDAAELDAAEPDVGEKASPADLSSVPDVGVLELEGLLAARLDTRVSVHMGKGRGRITIAFADVDDLERIYRLISV